MIGGLSPHAPASPRRPRSSRLSLGSYTTTGGHPWSRRSRYSLPAATPVPVQRHRAGSSAVHAARAGGRDHRLQARLPGLLDRRLRHRHRHRTGERRPAPQVRWLPIGNSRVKLTNAKDLVKRGLVKRQTPSRSPPTASVADGVDVLQHHRWRRHEHHRRRSRRVPRRERLRPDSGGLPKTIDKTSSRSSSPRRRHGRRDGCPFAKKHRRRAQLGIADAHRS